MGHHLILGELVDYLTGEILPDTLDERYRQKIARLLVEEKGFKKTQISARQKLEVRAGNRKAVVPVDFVVRLQGRICMVVRFGPGSLVTRHRAALAAARLISRSQIPVVVVTNGETADVLEGPSGKPLAEGLSAIPSAEELNRLAAGHRFAPLPPERAEKEARIVYAFEVDGACPCDDTICRLDSSTA
ncbi:MAG: type I restriction enzyme HsdR N-terminal domain-containing protein [Desulfobacterales bacterium]|jgi:hypothetical protein